MFKKFIFSCLFFGFFIFILANENSSKIPDDLLDITFIPDALIFESIDEFGGFFFLENFGLTPTNVFFYYELKYDDEEIILNYSRNFTVSTNLEFYDNFTIFKNLDLKDGYYVFYFNSNFTDYYETYKYKFLLKENKIYDLTAKNYITWTKIIILIFSIIIIFYLRKIYFYKKFIKS